MSTISLSDIDGVGVVAASNAEEIGSVKSLVLNRRATRVQRVQVGGKSRAPELVEWSRVDGVGGDVIMVHDAGDVHESNDDDDALYTRGDVEIVGTRVLDSAGFEHGQVTDLHFDGDTGDVVAFMTSDGRIAADRVRSLGTYALVYDAS